MAGVHLLRLVPKSEAELSAAIEEAWRILTQHQTKPRRPGGRPAKLSSDYHSLLLDMCGERLRPGESLSTFCRDICKNGGLQFLDRNRNLVAEITKWRTLHTRLTEALSMLPPRDRKAKRAVSMDGGELFIHGGLILRVPTRYASRKSVIKFSRSPGK